MEIYSPKEDSFLLSDCIKRELKGKNFAERIKAIKFLDIGCGTCIQSDSSIKFGVPKNNIIALDINLEAGKYASKLGIKFVHSDLFEHLSGEKFDLIVFNPPYLPEDKFDKGLDTTGGKKGDEVILRFIKELKKHLTENGICLLLTSSLTPEKNWMAEAGKQKLFVKKIAEKNLFFESLFVWEISFFKLEKSI
jgi:release factor glutamine methyltransferase